MNIILLSGGSGKRLWPLSNDCRSKQFIKLFRTKDQYESMVQRIYHNLKELDSDAVITIATAKTQVSSIRNQLGEKVGISVEPCRRDTFPAIVLAAAYLRDVCHVREEEGVIVCPVDPYVETGYFEAIQKLGKLVLQGDANLYLMGIEPTYPSEKYGYVIPENKAALSKVAMFKEKPSEELAKSYIAQGALWNGGVFGFRLGYILKRAEAYIGFSDYYDLYAKYESLPRISFDYAVAEKETNIMVMRYSGEWKDLGTWNTLTEAMDDTTIGKVIMDKNCRDTHVVNELNIPILCMGVENLVVAASPEGILVSEKEASSHIKPYVDTIHQQIMFAEKSWGSFRVLDVGEDHLTIKVTLQPGQAMNYHSHEHRDEHWIVLSGEGMAVVDGQKQEISAGDRVFMPLGSKHTVKAKTLLQMIEVQTGKEIHVSDKKKYNIEL